MRLYDLWHWGSAWWWDRLYGCGTDRPAAVGGVFGANCGFRVGYLTAGGIWFILVRVFC